MAQTLSVKGGYQKDGGVASYFDPISNCYTATIFVPGQPRVNADATNSVVHKLLLGNGFSAEEARIEGQHPAASSVVLTTQTADKLMAGLNAVNMAEYNFSTPLFLLGQQIRSAVPSVARHAGA